MVGTAYERTTHLLFGFRSPTDWLGKLEREHSAFCAATDPHERTGHAMNFAITAWAMCDWLAAAAVPDGTQAELDAMLRTVQTRHLAACASLAVMRDIANAAKHRALTRRRPTTVAARTSLAPPPGTIALSTSAIYVSEDPPDAEPQMIVHNVETEEGKSTFLRHAEFVLEHFRRELSRPPSS
jgi:hypothetical protein